MLAWCCACHINKAIQLAEILGLAVACLHNGVGELGIETYEDVCKNLNLKIWHLSPSIGHKYISLAFPSTD